MRAMPVRTENGVKKSSGPPAKTRPSTLKPWMKAPSIIPCTRVAISEPVEEAMIPEGLALGIAKAELEGDAAKHQRQQHGQDRKIKRRDEDGEGKGKGRKQCDAAQHQPGLVAVPYGRNRVHHEIARSGVRHEVVEHAHAQVEAVEQDIEEDAGAEDQRPHGHEVQRVHSVLPSFTSSTWIGARGRPLSIGATVSLANAGPLRTSPAAMRTAAG